MFLMHFDVSKGSEMQGNKEEASVQDSGNFDI